MVKAGEYWKKGAGKEITRKDEKSNLGKNNNY